MKIKPVTKLIQTAYVEIEDKTFRSDVVFDLIDALDETDGFANVVVIYDRVLQDKLELNGVINVNVRGSCYKGKNFEEFKDQMNALYGE